MLDVILPDEVERLLHEALSNVADQASFHGDHRRIDLLGSCTDCANLAAALPLRRHQPDLPVRWCS